MNFQPRSGFGGIPMNQLQIANIHKQPQSLPQHKHRICTMNRIDQQSHPAGDAQIPERHRNHTFLFPFAAKPLHDEPAREHQLAD